MVWYVERSDLPRVRYGHPWQIPPLRRSLQSPWMVRGDISSWIIHFGDNDEWIKRCWTPRHAVARLWEWGIEGLEKLCWPPTVCQESTHGQRNKRMSVSWSWQVWSPLMFCFVLFWAILRPFYTCGSCGREYWSRDDSMMMMIQWWLNYNWFGCLSHHEEEEDYSLG